jgi:2-methylcitrate dehydratase PrpD
MEVRGAAEGEPSQKNPKVTDREKRNLESTAGEPSQKNPEMTDREQRNRESREIDYLDRLAAFAADVHFDKLPPSTVEAAKLVLLDTLGAILAGSQEPENVALAHLAAHRCPSGAATLIGHAAKANAFWAALVNATAGVALEVDEGSRLGGGHPSIHTLPGALAVAEERDLDGRRLLEALIAGYEVGSRIGGATTARANVHSHGTWGTISTAVAAARLSDVSAETMRDVINLSASMTPANSWTPALVGATIRNLYPGRSAFQGILAVDLQRCGFTGLADAPSDVYGTILADAFDPSLAVAGLEDIGAGEPYRIEQNYFKFHACCRYNHFALDAIQALRAKHALAAEDVAKIQVATIPFGVRMADPEPTAPLAARFSIPYAVAASLVLGRTDPTVFRRKVMRDQRIRDLARRVEVTVDPEASPRRIDRPTAQVRITLRNGTALESTLTIPRGDAANPVPAAEVEAKFLSLVSPVLGDAPRTRRIVETAQAVDTLRARDLTALLTPR